MENQTNPLKQTPPAPQPSKKTYTRPKILFLAPLEATADVCDPLLGGKAGGTCVLVQS